MGYALEKIKQICKELSMDEIEKAVENGYNAVMRQKEKILAEEQ